MSLAVWASHFTASVAQGVTCRDGERACPVTQCIHLFFFWFDFFRVSHFKKFFISFVRASVLFHFPIFVPYVSIETLCLEPQ